MLRYGLVVLSCASAFYFLAVLAASLIDDDLGKTWGSIAAAIFLLWLARRVGMPSAYNFGTALLNASPLRDSVPWSAITVSLAASVTLALAALKVVQRREFSA
jgi:hypothetical protein